jgi:hypothetical protein
MIKKHVTVPFHPRSRKRARRIDLVGAMGKRLKM